MYNRQFGFQQSPFSITPDPAFFYANSVYLEVYANLRYGIENKKGFIAITGEVGTGKTTILRKLMRNLENTIHCIFLFSGNLNSDELLRVMLAELSLATEGKDRLTMMEELNRYLIEQLEKDHIVCLLIDEAQNLTDEALEAIRLVSNLETDEQKLIQIVLVGQPELDVRLDQPKLRSLKQRIAIRCEMSPLSNREVNSYIEFRLQAAGYTGKTLFEPEAVQKIAYYSTGIPRLINVICDNALLIAYAASKKTVSADIVSEVAADLRLRSPLRMVGTSSAVNGSASDDNRATAIIEESDRDSRKKGRAVRALGAMSVVAILVLLVLAFASDPHLFLTSAEQTVAYIDHKLNHWPLLGKQEIVLQKTSTETSKANPQVTEVRHDAEIQPNVHRIVLRYGSTIYEIATELYRDNITLAMDLIKEFNPAVKNLNWVIAGQELVLPAITRETLVRQQPDNSYRVVVGSFLNRTGADQLARAIVDLGYDAVITANRVSDNLVLHRIEIDGLKTREEATEALQAGARRRWLTLTDRPGTTGPATGSNLY
jgi:general secretion pathway protein A